MEDTGSPYHLHIGDHPGLVLVSHHLIGSNYNIWSRAMIMALTAEKQNGICGRNYTTSSAQLP
ncbi:hypothetical protein VitviT2T_028799 [Vitis vinifera]|uniref:Retrotransposon Copia-like N-terminal domain-containing protein n=1 Tax=Vitis vinifera TaxID=29760 RepID=A0ABY9DUD5_VITVI|nr:hypothetical protein VitviT2T_028799 [Vitis vinifera]